ncbi:amino acid adenylation domain-containing protein [Micromonospora sp. Llam7]|nr:amino acid adenylation domain-containing protein [Micromonospora tarapacensis]
MPATSAQEQLWLLQQLKPNATVNHLSLMVDIQGPLEIDALRRALQAVVTRHDALRAVFRRSAGTLIQEVLADNPHFTICDLESVSPGERDRQLANVRADHLRRPFDLADGPLIRFVLVVLDLDRYQLLLVGHRIVMDEASLDILTRELLDCYRSFAQRRRPELPPLPFRFIDFAHQAARRGPGADLDYWRRALADLPDPLELPFTRARGTELCLDAEVLPFRMTDRVVGGVRQLAEQEGTTPYAVLLTAFVVLLHRYTRSRDIVLGAMREGRSAPGATEVIGAFADLAVLRIGLPPDPTWREAVRLVRDELAAAQAHPDVSFQQLVQAVRPERHLNLHPLFQVMVAPAPDAGRHGVEEVVFDIDAGHGEQILYDVELRIDTDGGLLKVSRELFGREHAEEILHHYTGQLAQLIEEPDTHLSNLSLLTGVERAVIVRDWNQTGTDFPAGSTIQSLFDTWAERTPDAPALHWPTVDLTYAELEIRANQLAHHLRGLGVGVETRVGLYFGHTASWVVGALATLKAGGLYVPLDPAYPSDRLTAMCEDADVKVLLLHSAAQDGLDFPAAKRVFLDTDEAVIARESSHPPKVEVGPDNLAYIMFTSGSTGRAKAIGVTHRNVVRTVCETPYVDFRPTDTVGQASNISFDAATFEVWGALLNGARLVGLRKEDVLDPHRLKAQLLAHQITIFFLPAALMKHIVSEQPDTFGSLRYFFSGGEQADLHTIRRMLRHGPPENLINPYGPTETTVFAIVYRCNDMPDTETYVPIGYPIGNTTSYVLDEYLQPVPVGVVGELFVGGDGVARGYIGQSDLTADKFIADPFSDQPGARLYRTGDLARYRQEGMIDFLGRMDRQVKIRGFRVEPAEIENCLLGTGLVREASVQVGVDRSGDEVLVGYVTPIGTEVDTEQLREQVRARLPIYMVPGVFVTLSAFPLNANGKLDIPALKRVQPSEATGETAEAPTPTEARLLKLWQQVLGERIAVSDDMFTAGGDSLSLVRFIEQVGAEFVIEVPYRAAFDCRTVAALAVEIDLILPAGHATETAYGASAPSSAEVTGNDQQQLLDIWREVLEVPTLGPDDNFFDNGGHSLKVTRVVSRVRTVFGWDVPVSLLFENPTVATFAAALAAVMAEGPESPVSTAINPMATGSQDSIDSLLDEIERLSEGDVDRLLNPES